MRPAGRGLFVAFEGGDGTGKTTQCRLLVDALRARGVAVVATREPGGTALGDRVRDLLLHSGIDIGPMAEALLFAAARAQHVTEVIAPALARGETVVCDRFLGSSLVYQGIGLGLGMETVRAVNELATAGVLPDTETTSLSTQHYVSSDKIRTLNGRMQKIGGWQSLIFDYGN
ncbi:MAG TPA: dTMP kinase, partial [Armatimonadota bacterium]|nr:dTMP kinase [Armatimonadota bacterium]